MVISRDILTQPQPVKARPFPGLVALFLHCRGSSRSDFDLHPRVWFCLLADSVLSVPADCSVSSARTSLALPGASVSGSQSTVCQLRNAQRTITCHETWAPSPAGHLHSRQTSLTDLRPSQTDPVFYHRPSQADPVFYLPLSASTN